MSRSIAESISLLSETLGNCKTNLKEKSVADVDNIKISDVDEKIQEIQAGGGKAYVVLIPSKDKNGEHASFNVDYGNNHPKQLKEITVYLDQSTTKYKIKVYEFEPNDGNYIVYGEPFGEDNVYFASIDQKFNEPKLYFVDCNDLRFSI